MYFKTYEVRVFQGEGDKLDLCDELKVAINSHFKARPVNVNRIRVQADDKTDAEFWKEREE